MEESRKIKLGLLLPSAKKKKIQLPERIQKRCDEEGIVITDLEVDKDLTGVGPFDVFIHKAIDYHSEGYNDVEKVYSKIEQVKNFTKQFPDMLIVDDLSICEKLLERKYQISILQQCTMDVDNIKVFIPKVLEIPPDTSVEDVDKTVRENNIRFPILAKPVWATQKEGSHTMMIIFNRENLKDLPVPCIIQEFCNHGGVVYKVFVIGDRYNMCERPSVRDVDCSSSKTLVFDTRNVSKTGKAFIPDIHGTDPNLRQWISCAENPNLLNRSVIDALYKRVNEITGLKFYGMDILVEKDTGNYAFIDLNQFPGFTGIKNEYFVENLIHFIKQHGRK